jgi:hypothetical protein
MHGVRLSAGWKPTSVVQLVVRGRPQLYAFSLTLRDLAQVEADATDVHLSGNADEAVQYRRLSFYPSDLALTLFEGNE